MYVKSWDNNTRLLKEFSDNSVHKKQSYNNRFIYPRFVAKQIYLQSANAAFLGLS